MRVEERWRLVGRYFRSEPEPRFPLLTKAAFGIGVALIFLAVMPLGASVRIFLCMACVGCGYVGWRAFSKYKMILNPTDHIIDTLLGRDLESVTNDAASEIGVDVDSFRADGGSIMLVVAVDIMGAGQPGGERPPRVLIGGDGQLRAELYLVFVLFLSTRAITICGCTLDFRTGEAVPSPVGASRYENVILIDHWKDLPKPLDEMVDFVYPGALDADITRERVINVVFPEEILPVNLGSYAHSSRNERVNIAWPNADAVRELHRRLHT